jgi:hypothetical protein
MSATATATATRKSAKSVQRHFNPRLIIQDDRINVLLALKGIDVMDLLDTVGAAATATKIPRLTVHMGEGDSAGEHYIKELIETVRKNPNFCHNIHSKYIKQSVRKSQMILYIKNQQYPYDILGFATMDVLGPDLYVDLICTNKTYYGVGRHMIRNILERLRQAFGCERITLCATNDAHPFYIHVGFEDDTRDPFYCIPPLKKMVRRTRRTVRKSAKATTF